MNDANIYKYMCPFCGFRLMSEDVRAQRWEHDQKHHPKYYAMMMGIIPQKGDESKEMFIQCLETYLKMNHKCE